MKLRVLRFKVREYTIVVKTGTLDGHKGQRSKLQGYVSESVQSDIKLSFIVFYFF